MEKHEYHKEARRLSFTITRDSLVRLQMDPYRERVAKILARSLCAARQDGYSACMGNMRALGYLKDDEDGSEA